MSNYPKRTPLKAIRTFCIECQGESFQAVTECADAACPFYPYRHGTPPEGARHQPMKAIKQYCLNNCQCGAGRQDVVECQGDKAVLGPCPVFPFRLGVNPNISDATKEQRRLRAQERAQKGTFGFSRATHQTPFDTPESTKTNHPTMSHPQ